jgi:type VI protein secretion system component Hcp
MRRRARLRSKLRHDHDVEELEELLEQAGPGPAAEEKAAEEAKEDATKSAPADVAKQDPSAAGVLALQKTAGNRAVGAMLSRWPVLGTQQLAQWPKEPQLILDDTVIPLESFQEQVRNPTTAVGAGSTAPRDEDLKGPGDIVVAIKMGKYSPDLFQRSLKGNGYKTVQIVMPTKDGKGFRIILADVLISSYSVGASGAHDNAPYESLTLSFKKREFSQDPPPARR